MSIPPDVPSRKSRRYFLAAGAVAGAIAGLGPPGASAQRITANTPPQPTGPDQDTASLAARRDADDHLTVAVMLNGHGPFNFVVDTGAERSVVSDEVATRLNLVRGGSVTLEGIAKALTVATIRAETVAFGPFVRRDVMMPILPRATLAADGYLGLDVIDGTRVTFDFKNRQLHVEQPKAIYSPQHLNDFNIQQPSGVQAPDPPDTWVQAKGKAGRLQIVDCLVGHVPAVAFVDTGAELSVGNPALLAALRSYGKGVPVVGSIVLTGVTGGELAGQVIDVPRISLQALNFTDSLLAIADAPDFTTWGLHDRPAVLIGMNYLRQFASVTVDYRAKEIRFELSLAPPMPRPGVAITARG